MTGYGGVHRLRIGGFSPGAPAGRFKRPRQSGAPTLADVADADALIATFDELARTGGRAPGPDGLRYRDFSRSDRASVARTVARIIRDRKFAPGPVRQVKIAKKDGGTRTLRLANIIDRVVFALANKVMSAVIDPILSPRSHGFRPRRGVATLLAALEVEMTVKNMWVLVVDDARKAFDEVSTSVVTAALTNHVACTGLATFLGVLIRGHDGPGRCKGIDQGSALSPLGLNAALHAVHDAPLFEQGQRSGYRYADNFVCLVADLTEGQQVHTEAAELLAKTGLVFKGGKAHHLVDLGRGDELPLLGLILRKDGDTIAYRTGESAWERLQEHLRDTHHSDNPPDTTRAVVGSWISSLGPALANWTERDTRRVAETADGLGLHIQEPDEWIRGLVKESLHRWGHERQRALESLKAGRMT